MSALVSVICTVKNGEKTVYSTIESVLNQMYTNFEFIIVDDGSTDNTISILEEYKNKDKRIKPYYSGGIGRSKALNKAVELSSGNYIANIDADDLMHPKKLEVQIEEFIKHPDYFLLSTEGLLIYDNEQPKWGKITNKNNFTTKDVNRNILLRNSISHPSVLMNKKILLELGGYKEDRKSQVDYELWLRAYTKNHKMGIVNAKLYAKRIHSNQSFENKKRFKYTFSSMTLQLKYIISNPQYLYYLPLPIGTFILAQLPFKIRRSIISYFKKKL